MTSIRFVSPGSDPMGRVLAAIFTHRVRRTRIISSRKASRAERRACESQDEIVEWSKAQVESAGGGNYQSLINAALHEHMRRAHEPLEKTLRRVLREELNAPVSGTENGPAQFFMRREFADHCDLVDVWFRPPFASAEVIL